MCVSCDKLDGIRSAAHIVICFCLFFFISIFSSSVHSSLSYIIYEKNRSELHELINLLSGIAVNAPCHGASVKTNWNSTCEHVRVCACTSHSPLSFGNLHRLYFFLSRNKRRREITEMRKLCNTIPSSVKLSAIKFWAPTHAYMHTRAQIVATFFVVKIVYSFSIHASHAHRVHIVHCISFATFVRRGDSHSH